MQHIFSPTPPIQQAPPNEAQVALRSGLNKLVRKTHHPLCVERPMYTELHCLQWPAQDRACTIPVAFPDFANHQKTHQIGDLSCLCPILFPGSQARLRVFLVTKEGSEWRGWWAMGCGSYQNGQSGCKLWKPLGRTVEEFFARLQAHQREPSMHYYPPLGEAPSPPPVEAYLLDIPKMIEEEWVHPSPGTSSASGGSSPSTGGSGGSIYTTASSGPPTASSSSPSVASPTPAFRQQKGKLPAIKRESPDVFVSKSSGLLALSSGTLLHKDYRNKITGPLILSGSGSHQASPYSRPPLSNGSSRTAVEDARQYKRLAAFQDPTGKGISFEEFLSLHWQCPNCPGVFSTTIKDIHAARCKTITSAPVSNDPKAVIDLTKD